MEHREDKRYSMDPSALERIRRESKEMMDSRLAKASFEHLLEAAPKDEQRALLEEGDLHAALLGVRPAARFTQSPEMAERITNRLMADEIFGKKFRVATARGFIYNPEATQQIIDKNQEIFTDLGYNPSDYEALLEKALADPESSGRRIEVGLLVGHPKLDVLCEAAFFDDQGWKKARNILTPDVAAQIEEVVEKRKQEMVDPKYADLPKSKGVVRRHNIPGVHRVDIRNTGWNEWEESLEGTRLKNRIANTYENSGFDDLITRWRRRYPDLFPKEEPPEWLKKTTKAK